MVAAWIDQARADFGTDMINAAIRAGMDGQDTFFASENGQQVGYLPAAGNGARGCRVCGHFSRPGQSAGYCGGRDDLPPAYGPGHPLKQLPHDGGAACGHFIHWGSKL